MTEKPEDVPVEQEEQDAELEEILVEEEDLGGQNYLNRCGWLSMCWFLAMV